MYLFILHARLGIIECLEALMGSGVYHRKIKPSTLDYSRDNFIFFITKLLSKKP